MLPALAANSWLTTVAPGVSRMGLPGSAPSAGGATPLAEVTQQWQQAFDQAANATQQAPLGNMLYASAQVTQASPMQGLSVSAEGSVAQLADQVGQAFGQQLNHLQTLQTNADQLTQDFASGKQVSLHNVMIATNRAEMSLQLAMQLRNKALGAYQEIARMPL
jgi:flagellar hook-basal body complex protein FliE